MEHLEHRDAEKMLQLGSDSAERRKLFTAESARHPTRMSLHLLRYIVAQYVPAGSWLLDPMAGGGTVLVATLMGVNVVASDLEGRFVCRMRRSYEQRISHYPPYMETARGEALICHVDARRMPYSDESFDWIVTSPPFGSVVPFQDKGFMVRTKRGQYEEYSVGKSRPSAEDYSIGKDNAGNKSGPAYWDDMDSIYSECYRVLKRGGGIAVHAKDNTVKGQTYHFVDSTAFYLEKAGFGFARQITGQRHVDSFFSIVNSVKGDKQVRPEVILFFRKEV